MFGQFQDDFADGDFNQTPTWEGSDSKFIVRSGQLKLEAPQVNDFAYLTVPCSAINNASWEFFVGLDFNPSSTNYARIYLSSDKSNLSEPLNGYFVLLGNTADDVSLYKQSGLTYTKIIDGADRRIDLPSVSIRIKVTRDNNGLWELFTAIGPDETYTSEGTTTTSLDSRARYFGVFCGYTSTRSDKFHFDDFTVTGNPVQDNLPPTIDSVAVLSATELLVAFSESLDLETALNKNLYSVSPSVGSPITSLMENEYTVKLYFDGVFSIGLDYQLTASGIRDVEGNPMGSTSRIFRYVPPGPAFPKDIIFTEIFADPSPKIGLPESEFLELFNRSQTPYNMYGWHLTDGGSDLFFPAIILSPGDYLIITAVPGLFDQHGQVLSDDDFPSLNNPGDILVLSDYTGQVVDSVNYNVSWYNDDDRSTGGWSLELIDPENLCSEAANWTVSEDQSGGTPGKQNSVFANKPDLTGPRMFSAFPSSPTTLILSFNERLDKVLPEVNSFELDPSVSITRIGFTDNSLRGLELVLADSLQPEIAYSIRAANMYDCSGNSIQPDFDMAVFGLPVAAKSGDVVINEILFNPKPGGVDFVELVNRSQYFINLKNWSIRTLDDTLGLSLKSLVKHDYLLKPGAYIVLTEDLSALKGDYPMLPESSVLEMDRLPAFNDDEGSVVILDDLRNVIDYFRYSESFHSPFIDKTEGVSLERISPERPSNESQNWRSASSMAGFGTPGYPNSNATGPLSAIEKIVEIEPEAFVPVVGHPDFALIRYKFDQGGYVANVKIFDEQGHLIKVIANNEVLGTDGALRWDGDRENGSPARIGYYMVWFEIFDNAGDVRTFRERIAIAARF